MSDRHHKTVSNMRLHHLLKVLDLAVNHNSSPCHKNAQDVLLDEIMIFGRFTREEALTIMPLARLPANKAIMEYVDEKGALPIFRADLFFKPRPGHALALDFIQCFSNGRDPCAHERELSRDRELDCIALKFSALARDSVVHLFLRISSVLSSLCGFMRHQLSFQEVIDVLNRYLSPIWDLKLAQKTFRGFSSQTRITEGWQLVNECFKVFCHELALSKAIKTGNLGEQPSSKCEKEDANIISEDMINERIPDWYHEILCEFFTWIYLGLDGTVTVQDFTETIEMIAKPFLSSLLKEVKCATTVNFDMERLRAYISDVSRGEPSMAEIRYDPVTMQPTLHTEILNRTVKWNRDRVFKRCRRLSSAATTQSGSISLRNPGTAPLYPSTTEGEHRPSKKRPRDDQICSSDQGLDRMSLCQSQRKKRACNTETDGGTTFHESLSEPRASDKSQSAATNTGTLEVVERKDLQNRAPDLNQVPSNPPQNLTVAAGPAAESNINSNINAPPALLCRGEPPFETFLTELTAWNPCPPSEDDTESENLLFRNDVWLKRWAHLYKGVAKKDVTSCETLDAYGNHWKPLIMTELRGTVATEIKKHFPPEKRKPSDILEEFHNVLQNLRIDITKVSYTRTLTHLSCNSNDRRLTRAVARDLQGGVFCIGYIKRRSDTKAGGRSSGQPPLSIIACRNVRWDDEEYAFGATGRRGDDVLDVVEMSLTVNNNRFRSTNIMVGDQVIIEKLSTYAPYLRTFKAMYDMANIPVPIRRILCDFKADNNEETIDAKPLRDHEKTLDKLEARIDKGCTDYLRAIRSMDKINQSQHLAVLSALATMGNCGIGSSALSMIKGPPGTGKTDCIIFLIGALMHHSYYGHIFVPGHRPVDQLRSTVGTDSILRRSSNQTSFSFLVTASTNNAVDNVMLRIKSRGIIGKDGSIIRPEMCRIARHSYECQELAEFSLNNRALPFDHHIINRGQNRKMASTKAIRMYKNECILYFATLSTVGGPQWKDLKIPIDVAVTDEGAHPFEPETLLPMITTRRYSLNRRMLAVLVGDNSQLVEPALGLQLIREHRLCMPFNYEFQMKSLFDRLFSNNRVTCSMLLVQYRMHPSIAKVHFRYFYNGTIQSGRPPCDFQDDYNRGPGFRNGYAPFTCIDTSSCQERFERKLEGGKYYNDVEIDVIDSVLWKLYHLVGKDLGRLDGRIAILIPYRSQVQQVRKILVTPKRFLKFAVNKSRDSRKTFDIIIDTSDGMQGRERDIVIFAATRSNNAQEIGFLSDRRRLNVAMSRMRKLMIFIGDFSTLTAKHATYFSYIDRVTHQRECGADRVAWG